jgi:hypothetical protein
MAHVTRDFSNAVLGAIRPYWAWYSAPAPQQNVFELTPVEHQRSPSPVALPCVLTAPKPAAAQPVLKKGRAPIKLVPWAAPTFALARALLTAARDEVTCPIAQRPMINAVILDCGHSFSTDAWVEHKRKAFPLLSPCCRRAVGRVEVDTAMQYFTRTLVAAFGDEFALYVQNPDRTIAGASNVAIERFLQKAGPLFSVPGPWYHNRQRDQWVRGAVRRGGEALHARLVTDLKDSQAVVRHASLLAFVECIGKTPTPRELELLEQMSHDPHPMVAQAASLAFVELSGEERRSASRWL